MLALKIIFFQFSMLYTSHFNPGTLERSECPVLEILDRTNVDDCPFQPRKNHCLMFGLYPCTLYMNIIRDPDPDRMIMRPGHVTPTLEPGISKSQPHQ